MADFITRISDYLEKVESEVCKDYCKFYYDCLRWVEEEPGAVHRPEFDNCPFLKNREKV